MQICVTAARGPEYQQIDVTNKGWHPRIPGPWRSTSTKGSKQGGVCGCRPGKKKVRSARKEGRQKMRKRGQRQGKDDLWAPHTTAPPPPPPKGGEEGTRWLFLGGGCFCSFLIHEAASLHTKLGSPASHRRTDDGDRIRPVIKCHRGRNGRKQVSQCDGEVRKGKKGRRKKYRGNPENPSAKKQIE